ncbi:MAG: hypothetical protein AB7V01_00635 [Vicinamibacterales bacterium]
MSIHRLLVPTLLAVVAAGCINSATLISVKADGSGTVEQTLLVNQSAAKMMFGAPGGGGAPDGPVVNTADLERAAERMGGVRFVSAEPLTRGAFAGVKALYAFDDINTVQVSQDPQMSGSSSGGLTTATSASSPVRFTWARGASSSVLTVTFDQAPGAAAGAEPADPPEMPDPQMLGMMKSMFEGFKVAIDLQVDGTIVRTNADWVTGSRVTLLEMDLSALLDDQARLAELQKSMTPGASFSDVRPLLKGVKGIKVNEPVVTIEYR